MSDNYPDLRPTTVYVVLPPPASTVRKATVWAIRIGLLATGIYTAF